MMQDFVVVVVVVLVLFFLGFAFVFNNADVTGILKHHRAAKPPIGTNIKHITNTLKISTK